MSVEENKDGTKCFNQAARTWDEKPVRVRLARAGASAIMSQIPLDTSMSAMEYGCGTGLASIALAPALESYYRRGQLTRDA